eukprot:COSAG01_NODE_46_length_32080_cov_716.589319_14_plen_611_part_00
MKRHVGWYGSIGDFLEADQSDLIRELKDHHDSNMGHPVTSEQIVAWREELLLLTQQLEIANRKNMEISICHILLEYELPRERGRKPDVLILTGKRCLVMEFKSSHNANQADLDQAYFYSRDLQNYHEFGHNLEHDFVLVTTRGANSEQEHVVSGNQIADWLLDRCDGSPQSSADIWIEGDFAPLPDLVYSARQVFSDKPLPQIKTALSAGIPDAVAEIKSIAANAETKREHVLVAITGVPGAGKTLLGLQFCHEFKNRNNQPDSLLLSGNLPLIRVLQDALGNKVFVQDVHGFLRRYDRENCKPNAEHVLIFDEAQRAWDQRQVSTKRNVNKSEPQSFIDIGATKEWAVLIALIGSGQEIYKGEESGIGQWNDAIKTSHQDWIVHCPSHLKKTFEASYQTKISGRLNLSQSIRSHLATGLHAWVKELLDGNIDAARIRADKVLAQGFKMYVTRDFETAKRYLAGVYKDMPSKKYGAIASSEASYLKAHGMDVSYQGRRKVSFPKWFNSEQGSGSSCCDLNAAASEFDCQGLELDMAMICWARDLLWGNDGWKHNGRRNKGIQDPLQLTLNTYRVLLTRGRDGFVIFLPANPLANTTFEILKLAGVTELQH